jgi:hypothetical protein
MGKATMISLKWDYKAGEGELKKFDAFNSVDRITRLDFLTDCIHELQQLHDQIFFDEIKATGTTRVLDLLGITKQLTDKENKA